jgi:hypothetical protein
MTRFAANIMKVYFKNEKKPICIEIFIHSLKYINTFLILYTKCAREFVYVFQSAANQKHLRTTVLEERNRSKSPNLDADDVIFCISLLRHFLHLLATSALLRTNILLGLFAWNAESL